jgi:hypothetical protein
MEKPPSRPSGCMLTLFAIAAILAIAAFLFGPYVIDFFRVIE